MYDLFRAYEDYLAYKMTCDEDVYTRCIEDVYRVLTKFCKSKVNGNGFSHDHAEDATTEAAMALHRVLHGKKCAADSYPSFCLYVLTVAKDKITRVFYDSAPTVTKLPSDYYKHYQDRRQEHLLSSVDSRDFLEKLPSMLKYRVRDYLSLRFKNRELRCSYLVLDFILMGVYVSGNHPVFKRVKPHRSKVIMDTCIVKLRQALWDIRESGIVFGSGDSEYMSCLLEDVHANA